MWNIASLNWIRSYCTCTIKITENGGAGAVRQLSI